MPPLGRDDLYAARERGGSVFLIVDGVFGHRLAVSPREVVDVVRDGALILGASSMGAIRAAECAPAGVQGVGLIYRLYRLGLLDSDDEVAVAYDPEKGYGTASVPLVNVRYAMSKAVHAGLITRSMSMSIVEAARRLHFSERTWPKILADACVSGSAGLEGVYRTVDLKRLDANRGIRRMAKILRDGVANDDLPRSTTTTFRRPQRYVGHDRYLGQSVSSLTPKLAMWLLGTGRYGRYIWPLIVNNPELRELDGPLESLPSRIRIGRAHALIEAIERFDLFSRRLWHELDYLDEIDAELVRWYAAQTLAEEALKLGLSVSTTELARTREEVAIAHGLVSWRRLMEGVVDGRLLGSIPLAWIDSACNVLALSRHLSRESMNNR
jgi:hypothetical protein